MNYYNEFDKKTAAWLLELIKEKLIPAGEVDERSIVDVAGKDLVGFTQCHFFAGIGGWSLALQLAGWPAGEPVWTGSCPCQPFSTAGKQKGVKDKRHLWPEFMRLIREHHPDTIFGEQVASAIGHGWLDGVSADLETEGYACGATVLGAHSVHAPHIRQRLYWVADYIHNGHLAAQDREYAPSGENQGGVQQSPGACVVGGVADGDNARSQGRDREKLQECLGKRTPGEGVSCGKYWGNNWHLCTDGKFRRIPVEPAFFPLADGLPARVVRLRGYGNAIIPQVAAEFIKVVMGMRD